MLSANGAAVAELNAGERGQRRAVSVDSARLAAAVEGERADAERSGGLRR
jgi:hypothetical protein